MDENETTRRVAALRASLANGEHLDFENEIVPYVDGRLDADAQRNVEAHLARCEVCRAEVDDLRRFASVNLQRPTRRIATATLATAAAIAIGFTVLMQKPAPPQPVRIATPALTVSLRDGDRVIGIDRTGALQGVSVDAATAQRAMSVLVHPDLGAPSALASLAGPSRALRGNAASTTELAVVSPAGIAVADARPEFAWRGPANAHYTITIIDDGTQLQGETKSDRWTPTADLPRGRTYTWQVATMIDGHRVVAPAPPAPPALFRVLDQKTADAIASAPGHLMAGMLAYEAGAIADARHHFEQLAAANPGSPIPMKLIASCDRALR